MVRNRDLNIEIPVFLSNRIILNSMTYEKPP